MKIIKKEEIKEIITSGSLISIGGFTINRKPIKIIKEICKSKVKNLKIFTLAGALDIDLLLDANKIKKIFSAYVGYEGLGISQKFRKAVEESKIEIEDLTEILYYFSLKAGAEKKDFISTESIINSDIMNISSLVKKRSSSNCEVFAINPDFCLIHAQKADKEGNIFIQDADFCEIEMAKASKKTIFSVEEIGEIGKITIPKENVDYLIVEKESALPTGCSKYYSPKINEILKYLENGK